MGADDKPSSGMLNLTDWEDQHRRMQTPHGITPRVIFAMVMIISIAALGRVVGIASPWFGLMASFGVLGVLDLAMPFGLIRLPRALREVRAWERRGRLYRALGVFAFGAFLRGSPARWLNRRVYLGAFSGDLMAVRSLVGNAEAAHFWGGLATTPYLALAWAQGWWSAFTGVILFDFVLNVYPILHLRSVRFRIERAMRLKKSPSLHEKRDE